MKVIVVDASEPALESVAPTAAQEGVSVALFAGFDADARFQVVLEPGGEPVIALSTTRLALRSWARSSCESASLMLRRPVSHLP